MNLKKIVCHLSALFLWSPLVLAQTQLSTDLDKTKAPEKKKEEVLENPTLKTLSGSLSPWSFFSSFNYKGGSLHSPFSAEQPNITVASERANLSSMSGRLGIKYRVFDKDNLSFQIGTFMATPFHSSHNTSDRRTQKEFDNNHQKLNVDDPNLSYFRTYYFGPVQNVTFLNLELTTRGVLTDFGYFGGASLNHVSAIPLRPDLYIGGQLSFTQIFFDQDTMMDPRLGEVSLKSYQTQRLYKAGLTVEYYPVKVIAVRFISDIGVYYQMRDKEFDDLERRDLQQTVAMTYFFNRDISIAPSVNFILDDMRTDRTNLGLAVNVNL